MKSGTKEARETEPSEKVQVRTKKKSERKVSRGRGPGSSDVRVQGLMSNEQHFHSAVSHRPRL